MEVSVCFSDIWNFIKKNWWKLLIVVVLMGIVGAAMSLQALSPTYSSDSTVVLSCTVPANADKDYRLQYTSILGTRVTSGLAIANAPQMKQEIANRLQIPVSQIINITATQNQNAPSIRIVTSTKNAAACAKISDTACEIAAQQLQQMFPTPPLTVTMVDAGKKAVAVSHKIAAVKGAVLGGAFAVVLCFVFAVLKVILDKNVRNSVFVAEALHIPLLGTVGAHKKKNNHHNDEIRRIRSAALLQARDGRSLLFAPVSRNSQEQDLVNGVARSIAGSQKKVLLIDTDMKNPVLAAKLGIQSKESLYAVLSGNVLLKDAVVQTDVNNLSFLGCSAAAEAENAEDLLGSAVFQQILTDAKGQYDYVLLSAPSETDSADTDSIAAACDAVVMVVRYGITSMQAFRTSLARIRTSGGKVIGFVTTDVI